jgi:sulfur carrier protein ThiS
LKSNKAHGSYFDCPNVFYEDFVMDSNTSRLVTVISNLGVQKVCTSALTLEELLDELGITRAECPIIEVDQELIDEDSYLLPITAFSLLAIPNPDRASNFLA